MISYSFLKVSSFLRNKFNLGFLNYLINFKLCNFKNLIYYGISYNINIYNLIFYYYKYKLRSSYY